jgi:DNA-binding SARP family transcriptional activator
VDFRILGPLEVHHDGRAVPLPGARQRELLALLLLDAGRVISTERLMDDLWGDDQPTAGRTALRVRVSQLRKALPGDVLVTRPTGYALQVERDELDLWRFERRLAEGERALRSDPQRAVESLTGALAEWRGRPLADLAYAPWAQAPVVRLEELRAAALELRVEAELALGHHGRLVGELQALVAEHPLREHLWAQLMTALYRDGRQAEALAAYRQARARLVEEIGIEPGPQLQQLEARILAQDPELGGGTPTPKPARTVLAVCTAGMAPAAVAARLAGRAASEAVAVALTTSADDLGGATAALREAAPGARVAAFTSHDPAKDTVRLAAEQDAALLLVSLPADGRLDHDILRAAACDVALVGGGELMDGPVLVPFSGYDNDWAATEVGGWLGRGRVTLLGVREGRDSRDASRMLASASLALQRGLGLEADARLVAGGAGGILEVPGGAIVVGLSDRWPHEGIGKARLQLVREAACLVLVVRRGVRPGGLAPPEALTRFTWSGGG